MVGAAAFGGVPCRAVLFAQLVDDPSAWPDRFGTDDARRAERDRLHRLIEQLVKWESSTDETILGQARWEIARSLAWARGEEPPPVEDAPAVLAYLAAHAPPVCDPFCGGGSIPLEAQRLGLRAIASDLNPVAVLITKALVEIPPKFAGMLPVHPVAREEARLRGWRGKGAAGLAEDVRRYGAWMREEAFKRIGHLYPQADMPDGSKATVIAWIWARTVRSPNPAAKGAMVPLATSFLLSGKPGREVWLKPEVDAVLGTYQFKIQTGATKDQIEVAKLGTRGGKASDFTCLLTGSVIPREYVRTEGKAGRMSEVLLSSVVEYNRKRTYLAPTTEMEAVAHAPDANPVVADARATFLSGPTPTRAMITGGVCSAYGLSTWGHLFTARQLNALTTFADLVGDVRDQIARDAISVERSDDSRSLAEAGTGPQAYADAVATYLALSLGKMADRNSSLCVWEQAMDRMRGTFGRQAIPMVWDYVETNPFAGSGGDFEGCCQSLAKVLANVGIGSVALVEQVNAPSLDLSSAIFSSDPPYYDNIGYADLSDFFYVWLRRAAMSLHPTLFRTMFTPKSEELIASSYRHGGKEKAETFFLDNMKIVFNRMARATPESQPLTLYYAFKQNEQREDGMASTGWATFLQALHDAGLIVDGTWPMRTELATRSIGMGTNALASSIVLVCRRRPDNAVGATRNQFLAELRQELPEAIRIMQQEALAPVDLQQAAIGPGIGVFTRYSSVLESDDSPMPVRTALALINAELDAVLEEQEGEFDPATRFAVTWFDTHAFEERLFGEADNLARARAVGTNVLIQSGVLSARAGKARLLRRNEILTSPPPDAPHWVLTHALIQSLLEHGETPAAALLARLGAAAETCRDLAYRLFQVAERRKLVAEAIDYNALVVAWPDLQRLASATPPDSTPAQAAMAV